MISVTYNFVTGVNTGGAYAPAYLISGVLFFHCVLSTVHTGQHMGEFPEKTGCQGECGNESLRTEK